MTNRAFLAVAAVAILLSSCAETVPPDVVLANECGSEIIAMQTENARDLINAYEADLDAAYTAHENERLDTMLATGSYDTPDKIRALVAAFEANRERRRVEADNRKARFFATLASNARSADALSAATRKYLDDLTDKRAALKAIIDAVRPTTPPTGPSPIQPLTTSRPTGRVL